MSQSGTGGTGGDWTTPPQGPPPQGPPPQGPPQPTPPTQPGWQPPPAGGPPPPRQGQPGWGPPAGPPGGWGPPPGPPPGAWGAPPPGVAYGYGPPETESGAIVALVLAIASWVLCPVLPAVAALIVGGNAKSSIQSSGGRKTGEGLVTAANIVSWINLGFSSLIALFVLVVLLAGAASAS